MRTIIYLIIFSLILTSCRYKEGPLISFRKVNERIRGHWEIAELTSDGVDSLKYYNDSCGSSVYIYVPNETAPDYIYIHFIRGYRELDGRFRFSKDRKYIEMVIYGPNIIGPIGNVRSIWEILKLSNKNFKIKTNVYEKEYIISFKRY